MELQGLSIQRLAQSESETGVSDGDSAASETKGKPHAQIDFSTERNHDFFRMFFVLEGLKQLAGG